MYDCFNFKGGPYGIMQRLKESMKQDIPVEAENMRRFASIQ